MLKKILALALAGAMVIGSMSLTSFAATGDLTPDTTITITGLDDGDIVSLYKVMEWVSGEGWRLVSPFDTAEIKAQADIDKLLNPVKGQAAVELTKETVEKLNTLAKTATAVDTQTVSGTSYTYTTFDDSNDPADPNEPGMYLALVKPFVAGTVYNPIVVSADYSNKNATNEINASSAMLGTAAEQELHAVAKKKPNTVDKEEPKITNDIGDTYSFEITTTIPTYAESFVDTFFNIFDEVTKYLKIDASTVQVLNASDNSAISASDYDLKTTDTTITIKFDDTYIKALAAPQDLLIKYDAKLTISKEDAAKLDNATVAENKVTITFPNDPKDDTSFTVLRDGTRERTFTIDGKLAGHSGWQNSELVKVALDENGSPLLAEIAHSNGKKHSALNGAVFGLFTDETKAKNYKGDGRTVLDAADDAAAKAAAQAIDGLYYNDVFFGVVETANGGLMYMNGLDEGTYYLKELTAPEGFIKDQNVHEVKIEVTKWKTIDVTEYYTVSGTGKDATTTWYPTQVAGSTPFTYTVKDVEEYRVTFDGRNETSYNMELSGPYTSSSTILKSEDAEVANTKGVELPSTGGIGTTLFYAGGAILVLLAGVLLVSKRRIA